MTRPEDLQKPDAPVSVPSVSPPVVTLPDAEPLQDEAKAQVRVEDEFEGNVAFRMAFIGCGQGGGRLADSFYRLGYRRVGVINTTVEDLHGLSPGIRTLDLGGRGACKDPKAAAAMIADREEAVWDLLTDVCGGQADYICVCAGLGGGTGTGLSPYVAKVARDYMEQQRLPPRVGAVVSLPVLADGQRICGNAVTGFRDLWNLKLSPLIVIDNQRIYERYNKPAFGKMYDLANKVTAEGLHLFNQLAAYHSDLITFDRSEFHDVLDHGLVVMGQGSLANVASPADISRAIGERLSENMLAPVDLKTGSRAACLFVCGEKFLEEISVDYYGAGFEKLERMLDQSPGRDPVVHRGIYRGSNSDLQFFVLISGLSPPKDRLAELAAKGRVPAASNDVASYLKLN